MTALLAALLALSACGGGQGAAPDETGAPTTAPLPTTGSATPPASPTPASTDASPDASTEASTEKESAGEIVLTGTFSGDPDLEGGCAWVESGGERYELILPDGYEVDISRMALTGPDGAVIAEGGDEVRFSGSEATDMASFCQVGRLFRVTEIAPG